MTTEQQIQERAREAADKIAVEPGECKCDPLPVIIDALTAQHVATEAAHREEVERLTKELKRCFAMKIKNEYDEALSKYRYTLEEVPDAIVSASEKEGIQVDVSKAKSTKRPISYQLSWETKHGECHCIAWNEKYGTIRGTVEDSPQGRRLFRHRIMSVWPNAEIVSH